MTTLVDKARSFAREAHRGQVRKFTREQFIVHPFTVAHTVKLHGGSDEMVAAALLHDTVEDCPNVQHSDVRSAFGDVVGNLVWWLTKPSQPWDGNRAERKAIDLAHLAKAPADAKTIKLADIIDNSRSFIEHDPKFWRDVYRAEKLAQIEVCHDADVALWSRAWTVVADDQAMAAATSRLRLLTE